MPLRTHLILRAAFCLSALFLGASCSSSDARAQRALTEYQSAAAANDLVGSRRALLKLVQAKDDVSEYWVELGKVEASMGSFGEAYYAFTRAYELDQSDLAVLHAVTELALRTGDIALAQSHARELEVIAPGDPWIKLTDGWAAIRQSRWEEAIADADSLLASDPFGSAQNVLKARGLLGLGKEDEAIDLLNKQVQSQPSDQGSLQLLSRAYAKRGEWPKAADASRRLSVLTPADRDNSVFLVEAALRSQNIALTRAASARLLKPDAEPTLIGAVLALWEDLWPSPQRIQDARSLAASAAGLNQKLVYAAFLNRVGSPADGARLSAGAATFPVNAASAEANAVLADAWWRMGKTADAKRRFDAVLAFDPGNSTALRGRTNVELKAGDAAAAIVDAQKLVTVLPSSPKDRLLLARAYVAAGNRPWAERTLWTAFQDIPGDERIFAALQSSRRGNSEATLDLQQEFARQRDERLGRGIL